MVAALLAAALLAPSHALAQQSDEVFVDPDSPAEKEYALPIDQARRNADPTRRPGDPIKKGAPSAPLFGVGIDPGAPKGGSTGGRDGSQNDSGRSRSGEARGAVRSGLPRRDEVARLATSAGTAGGATGTTLLVGGAGGVILLAGIVGGLLLRRRRA